MAPKHGLIEIRLDRRQAFYALIGSLLIVSVAFVVGLIVGQRMQLSEGPTPGLAVTAGEAEDAESSGDPLAPGEAAPTEAEQPHYTFYDELGSAPPRPLLNPSAAVPTIPADPIGDPVAAVRLIPRETEEAAPAAEGAQEDDGASQPAAEPVATAPTEPREEPVRLESPRHPAVTPVDGPNAQRDEDAAAPAEQRRTVRRVGSDEEAGGGPEEFGYYTVEVGRFSSFSEASQQSERLRAAGHDAIVTIIAADGEDSQYRVQVGSFTRRTEANRAADSISGLGMRARVVQEG